MQQAPLVSGDGARQRNRPTLSSISQLKEVIFPLFHSPIVSQVDGSLTLLSSLRIQLRHELR